MVVFMARLQLPGIEDLLENLGHRFKTRSDTEVIAHAYEEYGENCFQYFKEWFAIAIWDEKRRQLY